MEFLRLYLGEFTGLVLVLIVLFLAASAAARYFPNKRRVRLVRNIGIAAVMGAFAASWVASITVNQVPRGRVNRSEADQDQKAFEQRYSGEAK